MNELTPNLMVQDVNRTVEFYKNVLGFNLVMAIPEKGRYHWALMHHGSVKIMFQLKESFEHELKLAKPMAIGGSFTLYITLDAIRAFYNKIIEDVTLVNDLHETLYETVEFTIKDINSYLLTFAQPLDRR